MNFAFDSCSVGDICDFLSGGNRFLRWLIFLKTYGCMDIRCFTSFICKVHKYKTRF